MTIIRRLSESVSEARKRFWPIEGHATRVFYGALIAGAMIGQGFPSTGWTADVSSLATMKPRQVVAAGVGYENAETATITVKTYDAESGVILSDETYELNVREDAASAGTQPRERIFAGGVGPCVDGLSAFRLRVYDSATGEFLWEGVLNLGVGNQESNSAHRTVAHLTAPRATVTQVRSRSVVGGQPEFFLRAADAVTGQLMWTEGLMGPSQQIEFLVQMMDDQGRQMIWEDTIEPNVEGTDMAAGFEDEAENLPVWRGEVPEEMRKESI
jgi:hypothetical protein